MGLTWYKINKRDLSDTKSTKRVLRGTKSTKRDLSRTKSIKRDFSVVQSQQNGRDYKINVVQNQQKWN